MGLYGSTWAGRWWSDPWLLRLTVVWGQPVAQRELQVAQRLSSWGSVTFHLPGTGDREVCANEVDFPYNYSSLQKPPHLIISVIFKGKKKVSSSKQRQIRCIFLSQLDL